MKLLFFITILFLSSTLQGQQSLEKLLKQHTKGTVAYITPQELSMPKTSVILLDARERTEFEVSHLKNAIHIGYNDFKMSSFQKEILEKDTEIVVYCSLGIRSEVIADSLLKAGYLHVRNLFGGIFEWKNNGFPVYNSEERATDSIHAFSKEWGKWLKKGIKVYE